MRTENSLRVNDLEASDWPSARAAGAVSPPEQSREAWDVLDLSSDGIMVLDEKAVIIHSNARALALLQCTLPDMSGCDFWDAVPPETAAQFQEATDQALLDSTMHSFVAHRKFENTSIEYVFRRQSPGYVVTLKKADETEKLQRQLDNSKRYNQLIFEANPNAMWVFDLASLQIFAVNQAAIRFYGIARKKFMTLGMEALFPEGEGAGLLRTLRSGKDGQEREPELLLCKQRKMNGQQALVELAWSSIDWDGNQAILVSIVDVSERHLADGALRRANAELSQALALQQEELKTTRKDLLAFTQAVSSDLQDSLHAAHGFTIRLAEKYSSVLDNSGRHYVSRIQLSIRQLTKLVDDLRTLVQLPLRLRGAEKIDLAPLCHALVEDLRKRNPGREVAIEMEASLPVTGNKEFLATAMACLLENAWKFTSKKTEAWIKIDLLPGKAPGELLLHVSDNGAGFDAAYEGKLFTAFQRLHSSADFPGNGLGLAIVKRVAQMHGGRVWAESNEQAGASFFMALAQPAAEGNAPDAVFGLD